MGPIFSILKSLISFTKKTICGFPTLTAVPPECSLLFESIILIFKFFVSSFSDKGISFHCNLALPISVVTMFLSNIFDSKFPFEVDKMIFSDFVSSEINFATHLVPVSYTHLTLPTSQYV